MIQYGHLQCYDLTLTVKTPMHIGNGKSVLPDGYLFDPRSRKVTMLNTNRLVQQIVETDSVDRYESFVLGKDRNLYRFLKQQCGWTQKQIDDVAQYTMDASDALCEHLSLKKIFLFTRNAQGQAYVPGSSIKGALRTVWLQRQIRQEADWQRELERNRIPEGKYMNTLNRGNQRYAGANTGNLLNSLFRGVSITDSQPIPDTQMMLASKFDADTNGNVRAIDICRECIQPGTQIHMKLVLDRSVLKNELSADDLLESIREYDDYYQKHYAAHFRLPQQAVSQQGENPCIFLGGGAGFFAKNLIYPYLGDAKALQTVMGSMTRRFRRHHHERDAALGISPHTMKYTRYRQSLYEMGICEVTLT